jgi:hypothetical protein
MLVRVIFLEKVAHVEWETAFASAVFILHIELDVFPGHCHIFLFFRGAWLI